MQILGIRVDNVVLEDMLKKISDFLVDGKQHQVATINPEFILLGQKDREFKEILNQTDLNIADGFGIILGARLMGKKLKERITGVDLMENIFKKVDSRIFLLGGQNGAAEKIAKNHFSVVGFGEDLEKAVESINICRPDILFVALGAPKQEKWIAQNLNKISSVKVAIGVGGAFKFISGQVKRAPRWLRQMGLEWIWRTIKEPSRIRKMWRSVVVFSWLVLKTKLKLK